MSYRRSDRGGVPPRNVWPTVGQDALASASRCQGSGLLVTVHPVDSYNSSLSASWGQTGLGTPSLLLAPGASPVALTSCADSIQQRRFLRS